MAKITFSPMMMDKGIIKKLTSILDKKYRFKTLVILVKTNSY